VFDEVLGSDGRTNLRSGIKVKVLIAKFGERGFDYAGNSTADFAVWRGAREAIVVNASRALAKQAAGCARLGPTFTDNYNPFFPAVNFLRELLVRSGYLLAVAAGLVLATAYPKIGIAGCAWVAPALMLWAAHGKSNGDSFRVGYLSGLAFWLASLYWLLLMPVAGLPILGWLALSAFLALFSGAWVWLLAGRIGEGDWTRRTLWSLAGATIWVALEMIRARVFGGFPWNFIGVSQYQMVPLIQIASIAGVYGVSFLVVWFSLSLYSAVRIIFRRTTLRLAWQAEILLPLAVVIGLFVFGEIRIQQGEPAGALQPSGLAGRSPAPLRVTLVQPSIPQTLIWDETANSHRFEQLLALSERALDATNHPFARPLATLSPPSGERDEARDASGTDLLIWPESAVPEFDNATYSAITNFVRLHHVWLIFNADDVVPHLNATNQYDDDYFNAAFLCDPNGNFSGVYHKQKLVIFGEYIPLVRWLPVVKWFTPITGSYTAGDEPAQFQINRWSEQFQEPVIELNHNVSDGSSRQIVTAAPLICFEDTFPLLARKAVRKDTDFLVNLTNDGWFGDSAEQWQHMASAVFRAVENDVPLVRCCNNGITCWIDAHGRVREIFKDKDGSVYGAGAMTFDLPVQTHTQTFYNRHGNWIRWGCFFFGLIALGLKVTRR
ncbi:MAG TPA: apolipoprotein N-acyltransferase, partial [Verrucomicrobiae bacterium]|nr:apolipoprotein N-acyltransferase [Verrucomicrobiae bacterium]